MRHPRKATQPDDDTFLTQEPAEHEPDQRFLADQQIIAVQTDPDFRHRNDSPFKIITHHLSGRIDHPGVRDIFQQVLPVFPERDHHPLHIFQLDRIIHGRTSEVVRPMSAGSQPELQVICISALCPVFECIPFVFHGNELLV